MKRDEPTLSNNEKRLEKVNDYFMVIVIFGIIDIAAILIGGLCK